MQYIPQLGHHICNSLYRQVNKPTIKRYADTPNKKHMIQLLPLTML